MMKKNILLPIVFLILSITQLSSFPLFMPEDSEVTELLFLYSRAGIVFPEASFPISTADLDEHAARLIDTLSEKEDSRAALTAVREYREALQFEPGRPIRGQELELQASGYLREDLDTSSSAQEYRHPNDFYTRYVDFPDIAHLALWAGVQGSSGMHISAGIKKKYVHGDLPYSNLFLPTGDGKAKIENYMIRTGYLAWRGDNFEMWFGRSPVHFGDPDFNSFLPSRRLPWLDAFTYRYQLGPLTMTSYFGTLENRKLTDGPGGDEESPPAEVPSKLDEVYNFERTIIFNSMHRFVFSWERFRFGVTSAQVTARENNALHMGDFFPVFSWHNTFVGHHNMFLVLDSAFVPFPGMSIYGQAGWDDINAESLFGVKDVSGIPTIGAYLLGAAYRLDVDHSDKTMPLVITAEAGKTHYLWGNYHEYESEKGGYLSRAIYRYHAQDGVFWMPLTSPYGPGTWWLQADADLSYSPAWEFKVGGVFLRYKPSVNLFDTPYLADSTLQNADYESSVSLYFEGGYSLSLSDSSKLLVKVVPAWYSVEGQHWPELEFSLNFSTSKINKFER